MRDIGDMFLNVAQLRSSGQGSLDSNVGHVRLQALGAKGFRTGYARQAKNFTIAIEENQVAGFEPLLPGLHFDLDIIEIVERHG